jgi:putative phosphoribosyl transferase
MFFKNRTHAGKLLAMALTKYQGQDLLVIALPRGGVPVALEIARTLHAPLDLALAHKIGHPSHPEYAIAAVSETGRTLITAEEAKYIDPAWLEAEKKRQIRELADKRALFLKDKKPPSFKNKTVILVDDGIATGATMKVAIQDIQAEHPRRLVVAVPVAPHDTADEIRAQVDDFVALKIASAADFMGAVGAHYEDFQQVENEEVIRLMEAR